MPCWVFPYDLYNNTSEDFNVKCSVEAFTDPLYHFYFPYGHSCETCKFDSENPLKVCYGTEICKLRLKKDLKNPYPCVQTRVPNVPGTLMLRTGSWLWQYSNRDHVKFILRPCFENSLVLHHINGDPYDNQSSNVALVNAHGVIEDMIQRCKKSLKKCDKDRSQYKISAFDYYENTLNSILNSLQSGAIVGDALYAWKIVEIVNPVITGHRNWRDAQQMLEDIGAAYPLTDSVKNKGYYHKRNKQFLLRSRDFCQQNNLIELLEKVNQELSNRR